MPNDDAPGLLAGRWRPVKAIGGWTAKRGGFLAVIGKFCGEFQTLAGPADAQRKSHHPTLAEAQAACEEAARRYLAELRAELGEWPDA